MSRKNSLAPLVVGLLAELAVSAIDDLVESASKPKAKSSPAPEPAPAPSASAASAAAPAPAAAPAAATLSIPVDIREADNIYVVIAELPGFAKSDIRVAVDETSVSISASHSGESDTPAESALRPVRSEISRSPRARVVELPSEIDPQRSSAKFSDGHLILSLPRKAVRGTSLDIA